MTVKCAKCGRAVNVEAPGHYINARKGACHSICPKRKRKRGAPKRTKRLKPGRLSKLGWEVRKGEVFLRDQICQWARLVMVGPCRGPLDVHHMIHRSKGGTDDAENLILLCRAHHELCHPEKRLRWSKGSAA